MGPIGKQKRDREQQHQLAVSTKNDMFKKTISKNDLFNLYKKNQSGDSAKAYFGSLTHQLQMVKNNQSAAELEKKAREEAEKMKQMQLEKTRRELDVARRKSLQQKIEMD